MKLGGEIGSLVRPAARYGEPVSVTGGLKLRLQSGEMDDRQIRFARLTLSPAGGGPAKVLVADARGRLRYRLEDGDYRLSVVGGPSADFRVRDCRWTTVRLHL